MWVPADGRPRTQDLNVLRTAPNSATAPCRPSRKPLEGGGWVSLCLQPTALPHLASLYPCSGHCLLTPRGGVGGRCYLPPGAVNGAHRSCSDWPQPGWPSLGSQAQAGTAFPGAIPEWAWRCGQLRGKEVISWVQGSPEHPSLPVPHPHL